MSSAASIDVRDLTKRYGAVEAVRNITFAVAPGEIFGLLGRNGAGKTTVLECLLGLRRPDAGALRIRGVDALAEPGRAKSFLGAQLQSAALQEKITPREALTLFGSFYRDAAPPGELLERFTLADKADARFDTLSGGQRQRLFLALAFVNRPEIVVLDEPTAGLDPQSRRELHQAITGLRAAGRTVLLSTHYLEEAEQLCDRIGIIDEGRLVAVGSPAALVVEARSLPRLLVHTARPLDPACLSALAGVTQASVYADRAVLHTTDTSRTLFQLVQHLQSAGNTLVDLHVQRPTLEDVFIELTGRAWSPPPPEGPAS